MKKNLKKFIEKLGNIKFLGINKIIWSILIFRDRKKINKYKFFNRKKDSSILILVLAGYKMFCKEDIYARLKTFKPLDCDVCVVSAGLYSKELASICRNNKWSYLSTYSNNICNILNISLKLFNKNEYIFKIDEDIFITKNFFNSILETHKQYSKLNKTMALFYAPLIPINNFGFKKVIERLNYENKFFESNNIDYIKSYLNRDRFDNPSVIKYMWGDRKFKCPFPFLDEIDDILNKNKTSYSICDCHFNIGAIMMTRTAWNLLGGFKVKTGNGLGADEIQLNEFSKSHNYPIIISNNTCVGHLSFGPANDIMKSYYLNNRSVFKIRDI